LLNYELKLAVNQVPPCRRGGWAKVIERSRNMVTERSRSKLKPQPARLNFINRWF